MKISEFEVFICLNYKTRLTPGIFLIRNEKAKQMAMLNRETRANFTDGTKLVFSNRIVNPTTITG
jgi:hypothetical protein